MSVFPKEIENAGKAVYVERNKAMIRDSAYCLFYYEKSDAAQHSGTQTAYRFAEKEKKQIINIFEYR